MSVYKSLTRYQFIHEIQVFKCKIKIKRGQQTVHVGLRKDYIQGGFITVPFDIQSI